VIGISRAIKILKTHRTEGIMVLSFMLSLLIHSLAETQYNEPGIAGVPWLVWSATIATVILRKHSGKGCPSSEHLAQLTA
jgi:cobalamin synthase